MKVLFLQTPLMFSLIPRHYPKETDVLTLVLRNEYTNEFLIPKITFSVDEKLTIELIDLSQSTIDLANITIDSLLVLGDPINNLEFPADFKTQNKYEITLLNANEIIYKGKLIVLEAGTDIQNYDYGSQTTSRFQYK
jgi:hypothetical protein